ncbi:SIS domain-containing protein [Mycobacterium sp. DL99]|uniref:isomerizing glutamine--fructose-6-phosphate transaminase n=1 Tax=Mycobacterium sp. DL99 TaxID=2528957 RepID=UPI0010800FA3|nr:SIS domain-containing protein [Mycobacterium sp. DL99]
MCGIIACRTDRPAVDYLRVGLRRLEYRGYDSVGVALQTTTGPVVRLRTTGRVAALEGLLDQWPGPQFNGVGIGHTRWATRGSVTEGNAHPHIDCRGQISLVHNGTIENEAGLRTELASTGHEFATTVDSEVLCHLIEDERYRCGDLVLAVRNALARVEGCWALAALEQGTGRIVVAAKGSPLLVAHTAHGDFAASDIAAIADWVDEFRILDDGDVVELTNAGRWRGREVELNGYTDDMAKEIDEQPQAAARIFDDLVDGIATGRVWNQLGLPPFERLKVIGCGTSLNAGKAIGNLARELGGIPTTAIAGSEAAAEVPDECQLCIAVSRSGETTDVLRAVEGPAMGDSPLLALTSNSHSTLARLADAVIGFSAGSETGAAATKTFVCEVVAGVALMISALVAMKRLPTAAATGLVDDLRRLPDQLAAAGVVAKCVIPPIADEFVSRGGFIFIARGSGLPYAAEGARVVTELTHLWAGHYPAGELKHGPLALVRDGTPVVVVGHGDHELVRDVGDVRARGGRVISIGPAGSDVPVIGNLNAPWGPIEAIAPMQILARTLAQELARDVDKPEHDLKAVMVE